MSYQQQSDMWDAVLRAKGVPPELVSIARTIAEGITRAIDETPDDDVETVYGFGDYSRGLATIATLRVINWPDAARHTGGVPCRCAPDCEPSETNGCRCGCPVSSDHRPAGHHDCHTGPRCCRTCQTHLGCRCDGDYYGRW